MNLTRTVIFLGLSQVVCWGTSYYLIGVLGDRIAADFGWSLEVVHGGFALALLVMGLSSPWVGRLIDRRGGRSVMVAGSVLLALGCLGLALSRGPVGYFAAWLVLGLAMRFTLYDAAFAALARIAGPEAKRPIAMVTLFGGLASTIFWPLGHGLAENFGWRGALFVYAGLALLTVPLHLAVPQGRFTAPRGEGVPLPRPPLARARHERLLAGGLYALVVALTSALNAAMSAHMIGILIGLGLASQAAVWTATLRGIGQSSGRLADIVTGSRLHALTLNLLAAAALPFAFLAGLLSGEAVLAALLFALLYGAGNGLLTITRGTLPLVLFDPRAYGALVGRLLVPSFLLSAAAPVLYAAVIERFGAAAALHLSIVLAALTLAASLALKLRFQAPAAPPTEGARQDPGRP